MFKDMVNGGVDIGLDLTCVVAKCASLIHCHFGIPLPAFILDVASNLEAGHRDAVALWLPAKDAVAVLGEGGREEVKKALWEGTRRNQDSALQFLASVPRKFYKGWSLGLTWKEVKDILGGIVENKGIDGEVARAIAEGCKIDEEGLILTLSKLRYRHSDLARVFSKLSLSTSPSALIKIARLIEYEEADPDLLRLEAAVNYGRTRTNGVIKKLVRDYISKMISTPDLGVRASLKGIWCLDYVMSSSSPSEVRSEVARMCNDHFPTETMACLSSSLPETTDLVVSIVRSGGADIEPLKRRCEKDGVGVEGLMESREGRDWIGMTHEERSGELTTLALGTKIAHARTFAQDAPPLQPPL